VAKQARRVIEISDGRIVADSGHDEQAVPLFDARREPAERRRLTAFLQSVGEAIHAAVRALRLNMVRTLLTLLGIVVGVAAVVALFAIGDGTTRAVMKQLQAFGANRLYVTSKVDEVSHVSRALTADDAELIGALPHVEAVMPVRMVPAKVRGNQRERTVMAAGVTYQSPLILDWPVEKGRFFTRAEQQNLATVAVIGKKVATNLFKRTDPLRKQILINDVPFDVIGVLKEKGAVSGDVDDDNQILFPFGTGAQRLFGSPFAEWISVRADKSRNATLVERSISKQLLRAHGVRDFEIYNAVEAVKAESRTLEVMTSLLVLTALISLVVGGIGVMNVMLMTVTERSSEIGIRMAVGASRSDVLAQFLIEAVVLAGVGGIVGLGVGWLAGRLGELMGATVNFTFAGSALGFGCAVATGVVCGYLPARRAANLDPVVALARN
ncbi:MAG TPA: ABC transporter permease, partial [Polyangiales bacterium]|nr:ABC transporter permease [Polyangiales bacterium]